MTLDCIIPVMNQCEYTEGILADIAAQEEKPDRIILIDNGSTDGTGDIIRTYTWDIGLDILCIRNPENIGVNASWNIGIWTSTADIVSILNNDLRIPRDFFKAVKIAFMNDPKVGYVIPRTLPKIEMFTPEHRAIPLSIEPAQIREGWAFSLLRKICLKGGPIPSSVMTFFGDDFLFDQTRVQGYKSIKVKSLQIFHYLSRTLYSSGGAEYWGPDIEGWSKRNTNYQYPYVEWSRLMPKYKTPFNEVPMHIDMSPYAPFYWAAIDRLLTGNKPNKRLTIVELGSRHGCSARIMLDRLPEMGNWQMFLVDPTRSSHLEELIDNIKVIFNQETAQEYAGLLTKNSVDLLHIDVDPHTEEYTREIFDCYVDKIKIGGMILFHDCTDFFGVKKFVDGLDRTKWEVTYCAQAPESPISAPAMAVRLK